MISSRKEELKKRFTILAQMFFGKEVTGQEKSINSEEDYEKFIEAMLQIYMAPIIELSEARKRISIKTSYYISIKKY